MGRCRSASGSHPAPVPRCCGGAARMEGRALPASYVRSGAGSVCQPDSGKSLPKVRGQQTRSGHGTGGSSARTGLSLSPVHGGGKGRVSLLGFRSMAGSSPAQRTVWTNPALWSATNQENFCFLRARAGDGAGVLCGGRRAGTGQFPHSGGKSPMGWFGERREKRPRRGESPGRQRGRTVPVSTDRQDAASGRGAKGACLVGAAPEGSMPEKGTSSVCAAPKLHRVSACPGPTDHCILVTIGDHAVVYRSFFPIKRAGRGREFEGGGTFSR